MKKEMELDNLLGIINDALKSFGVGKYSLRNYYYEGIKPIIKAYQNSDKILYDPVFTAQIVNEMEEDYKKGLVSQHINMRVRKIASLMEEYIKDGTINWQRIVRPHKIQLPPYFTEIINAFKTSEEKAGLRSSKAVTEFCGIIRKIL